MSNIPHDTVGQDYFAAALHVTPQAIANARRRAPQDFPDEVERVSGSPRFDRRAADEWIDSRRRSRKRVVHARPFTPPRLTSPALGLCYLALIEAERRHGLDRHPGSVDVSREHLRVRAAEVEYAEEGALRGWLHDVLGGPLSDADLADIAALNAALPANDLDLFGEMLVVSKAVQRHTDTTPASLIELILGAVGPAHRGVLDPAAGLGRPTVVCHRRADRFLRVGFDVDFRNVAAARSRAYLAGIKAHFHHLDSLTHGQEWQSVAKDIDILVCDAPHFRRLEEDVPAKMSASEVPSLELEFALAAANYLPADARGVIAVSAHALSHPAAADLRRHLVATRRLHRVVAVPASAVPRYRFDLALLIIGERMAHDSVVAFADIGDAREDDQALRTALSGDPPPAAVALLDLLATPDVDLSPVLRVLAAGGEEPLSSGGPRRGYAQAVRTDCGHDEVCTNACAGQGSGRPTLSAARRTSGRPSPPGPCEVAARAPHPRAGPAPHAGRWPPPRGRARRAHARGVARGRTAGPQCSDRCRTPGAGDGDGSWGHRVLSFRRQPSTGGHGGRAMVVSPATILRPATRRLNPWMVEAALNSSAARRQMASTGARRVDIDNLTLPLLPPTGSRSEAADALSRLNSLRDDLDDLRADLDRLMSELGEAIARSTLTRPEGSRSRWDAR